MTKKITALKVQKRNPNRVNIYLDGEYAFGLARITAAWLHVGQELEDEKIAELQGQDTYEVAYQRSLLFLSYRPRSQAEVEQRLRKHGYEGPVVEATVERLTNSGLIGDEQFARLWVENRSAFRPRSRAMLRAELRHKGVAEEAILSALEEATDEEELAYQAGLKRARRWAGLEWNEFRERLSAYLGRRGFVFETTASAVRRIWEEIQASEAEPTFGNEDERC